MPASQAEARLPARLSRLVSPGARIAVGVADGLAQGLALGVRHASPLAIGVRLGIRAGPPHGTPNFRPVRVPDLIAALGWRIAVRWAGQQRTGCADHKGSHPDANQAPPPGSGRAT